MVENDADESTVKAPPLIVNPAPRKSVIVLDPRVSDVRAESPVISLFAPESAGAETVQSVSVGPQLGFNV